MNCSFIRKIKRCFYKMFNVILSILVGFKLRYFIYANNNFANYFSEIISKYNCKVVRLGFLTSALVFDHFVLIINCFYDDRVILYAYRDCDTKKLLAVDCYLYFLDNCLREVRKNIYVNASAEKISQEIKYIENIPNRFTIYNPIDLIDIEDIKPSEYEIKLSEVLTKINEKLYPDIITGKKQLFTIRKSLEYSSKILEGDMKWIKDYKESIWTKDIEKLEWKYKIILNKHIKF